MTNQHLETFKATAQGSGWPTKVDILDTEWALQVDESVEDGGSNSGPNPMHYFSASLAGCQNEQVQVVAEELSLSIDTIDMTLEIDLDLSGFMGMAKNSESSYKQVRLNTIVHGKVTKEQVQELGDRVDNRCPVLGLLRSSGCEIVSAWSAA